MRPPLTPTTMHRWSSVKSELLWIYDGPEQSYGETINADHQHAYWLRLLRKGGVKITGESCTCKATEGQWILSPNELITQRFTTDAQILSIHFLCQWPTGKNLFTGTHGMIWDAQTTPKLERSAVALQRLTKRHFPTARLDLYFQSASHSLFMRFQNAFTLFLAEFSEAMTQQGRQFSHHGTHDERLTLALNCMHETSQSDPFPWERIAQASGLSRKHLDRLFYTHFGTTSRSYWEKMKLEDAIRLLETTTLSIKEVGYNLGFKQASHFSTWLTKHLGHPPREHRKEGADSAALGLVRPR